MGIDADVEIEDLPEGYEDWTDGDWSSDSVANPCAIDGGGCVCLKLVKIESDGTLTEDSSLSWDDFLAPWRHDYDMDGLPDTDYTLDSFATRNVWVIPVNVWDGYGDLGDMSGYSCEDCRELSPSYIGYRTRGVVYDDPDFDPEAEGFGPATDVTRGDTECKGIDWYIDFLKGSDAKPGIGEGYEWAFSALFQDEGFDYLSEVSAKHSATGDFRSYGIKGGTQWRFAWAMPWYTKFFEGLEVENYKSRFMMFRGWDTRSHRSEARRNGPDGKTYLKSPSYTINAWSSAVESDSAGGYPGWWDNLSVSWDASNLEGFDVTIDALGSYLEAEDWVVDETNPRGAIKLTIQKLNEHRGMNYSNGKHMFISKTTFYDRTNEATGYDTHHHMLWPLCRYTDPDGSAYGINSMLTTRTDGRSKFPWTDGSGDAAKNSQWSASNPKISLATGGLGDEPRKLLATYNPMEKEGLIERFGPYHYLPDHKEWDISFGDYITGSEFYRAFRANRTTKRQIFDFYDLYTKFLADPWDYDEQETIGRERLKSNYTFRKVKSLRYDPQKIYDMSDEQDSDSTSSSSTTITGPADTGGY